MPRRLSLGKDYDIFEVGQPVQVRIGGPEGVIAELRDDQALVDFDGDAQWHSRFVLCPAGTTDPEAA